MKKLLCLLILCGAFSASAQRFVRYFDTVTDMAASNPADPNVYVVVGGSVSFNDNQAARWKWVSGSVDPADGNTVVSTWAGGWPGKPAGRWKKINEASGIVIDTSGFITNYNVVVVNDKASLQNINVTNNIAVALVKGKYGMNDGWEGQFTFNAASTAVADDAFYVAPNTGVGMWERQTPNPLREIPATWFDPNLTNGVIQAAINYAASLSTNAVPGREVLLPPKFIEINGNTGLNMSNNVTLVGQNGTVLATSAGTVAGYQMIRANGVTNWGVKNLQLIGLASVGGYGIFVTNSSRGLWGGVDFATNFTTAPVWITNSSDITVFDGKWRLNSVEGYGARPSDGLDDTTAVLMALSNMQPQTGNKVLVPPGIFNVNLPDPAKYNWVLEGEMMPGSGTTNSWLAPFDPTKPVLTLGNASATTILDRSILIRNITFDYRAPNTDITVSNTVGQVGLSAVGGVYELYLENVNFRGFASRGLELIGGTSSSAPVSILTLNNVNLEGIQNGVAITTTNSRALYAKYQSGGTGYLTKITQLSGHWNGGTNGFVAELDGVELEAFGLYVDGYWNHLLQLSHTGSSPAPVFAGYRVHLDGQTDPHSANTAAIVNDQGIVPWGGVDVHPLITSGNITWSNNVYGAYHYITQDTNWVYYPLIYGRQGWIRTDGSLQPSTNTWLSLNSDDGLQLTTDSYLRIYNPGAGGSVQMQAFQSPSYYNQEFFPPSAFQLQIAVTNVPTNGSSLTLAITFPVGSAIVVSNANKFWTNVNPANTNWILIGADEQACASNLYNNLTAYTNYTFLSVSTNSGTNVVITQGGTSSGLTNVSLAGSTSQGGWASLWLTPQTLSRWQVFNGITYFIPSGELRFYDTGFNRPWLVATTNISSSTMTIAERGIGINNSSPIWPLTVGANTGQANTTSLAAGSAITNLTGTHTAFDAQMIANPEGNQVVTANLWAAMIEGGTESGITNDFTGLLGGARFGFNNRNRGGLNSVATIYVADATSLIGNITNQFGVFIDAQTSHNSTLLEALHIEGNNIFLHGGRMVYRPTAVQTLGVGDPLVVDCGNLRVQSSGGAVVSTATPTIADGSADGEEVMIIGQDDTATWAIQDRGTLVGSNVKLAAGSTSRVLARGSVLTLTWFHFGGYWKEKSWSP